MHGELELEDTWYPGTVVTRVHIAISIVPIYYRYQHVVYFKNVTLSISAHAQKRGTKWNSAQACNCTFFFKDWRRSMCRLAIY